MRTQDVRACVLPAALRLCQDPVAAVRQAAAAQCADLAALLCRAGTPPDSPAAAHPQPPRTPPQVDNGSGCGSDSSGVRQAAAAAEPGGGREWREEEDALSWFVEQLRAVLARNGSFHTRAAFVSACSCLLGAQRHSTEPPFVANHSAPMSLLISERGQQVCNLLVRM